MPRIDEQDIEECNEIADAYGVDPKALLELLSKESRWDDYVIDNALGRLIED